ncbi:hypothetical protein ACMWKE_06535 [Klebsiella pneumoniae]|jgi:hypothetical protein|uniref:hypothetical protein n=1 Tax=Klebsiella pneumoniae TaxID=573 RepID=UPI0020A68833|nr:hypothetical protein [Klebsiella pneumoniae]
MNIETVNELIASLESAGELSIREQKFLKLAKAFKQVTAERDAALNAECVWEKTMMEVCGEDGPASVAAEIRNLRALRDTALQALKSQVEQLAAENVEAKKIISECREYFIAGVMNRIRPTNEGYLHMICDTFADETPDTDRIVAGIKADGRVEGAHFVANRMLAAWDAGFIEDTAKNAADIARMILASTEFMANAPEGDFDRSFADDILADIAKQLREGAGK